MRSFTSYTGQNILSSNLHVFGLFPRSLYMHSSPSEEQSVKNKDQLMLLLELIRLNLIDIQAWVSICLSM